MSTYKPLCPCCFQAYATSVTAGEVSNLSSASNSSDHTTSLLSKHFQFCGKCAPSEIEIALAKKATKDTSVPPIVWLLTVEDIQKATQQILHDTKANLDAIAAVPLSDVTYENTIAKLQTPPNYKTNPQVAACKFLQHCSTDADIREAARAAGKAFSASRVAGRMRKDVYERVKAYSQTEEAKQLDEYRKHFVRAALKDFERAGLALQEEDANTLQQLLEKDSTICSEYGENLGSDDTKLFFTPEQLKGCTEDFIQDRLNKDEEGKCTITLKYPDIIPIGQLCEVSETRRQVIEAREGANAYKNNLDLVAQGIEVRKQIATLLGYPSWAEYICSNRMSGSYKTVDDFLNDLESQLQTTGQEDYERLLKLKEKHCQEAGETFDGKLNAWDTAFYNHRLLKTEYGVDSEAIRQYFPLDHVVETTLKIYQELLGLIFTELPTGTFWSWHPEVRCFDVHDTASHKLRIGHFYLDLHPRSGKYGHAAIFHLVKHNTDQGAVDCMLCNLPACTKDRPSLLMHSNVITFFHEFGHIMHGLCSEGVGNSTRLAKCPRDFVEAPSQMLENWVWQKVILQRLSKHYQTGQPLPDEMLQSMIRAKHVNVAFSSLRQIYLSRLDLIIHGPEPPKDAAGLQKLVDELRPGITKIENPAGSNMLRTFGHLMNQYSASYYGYMWAEVLSADMFTRFEKDCMDRKAGMDYRKMVLAPGGTHNITDHLTKFLGRPPTNEAFLKSRGILK